MARIDDGFRRADSTNLPFVDTFMMLDFLKDNPQFMSCEMRGVKAARSGRSAYGDDAVGYVQLKRETKKCIVKARITPEHHVSAKPYTVIVVIGEDSSTISSAECLDCAASAGGCKHVIALLSWLTRRTEEPAPTEVCCYWSKAKLSTVGSALKCMPVKSLGKAVRSPDVAKSSNFLSEVADHVTSNSIKVDCNLLDYCRNSEMYEQMTIDQLLVRYLHDNNDTCSADGFLTFCSSCMNSEVCAAVESMTKDQSKCSLWHHAKYARITASKLHEASHCVTGDGCFVEGLLGAKLKQTEAMKRGLKIEVSVLQKVEDVLNLGKIEKGGLFLRADMPAFGASPDGLIGSDIVIEVKCPVSQKSHCAYISAEGKITNKYNAQVQLQMCMTRRSKCYFCVASPDFEKSGNCTITEVAYDEKCVMYLVNRALEFWKLNVFRKLVQYYQ